MIESELQVQLHEFQTKYSLLQEKTSVVIEQLFELLANVQMDMLRWADWGSPDRQTNGAELYGKTKADLALLVEFFDRKRIYFEQTTKDDVIRLVRLVTFLLDGHDSIEWLNTSGAEYTEMSAAMKASAKNIVNDNVGPLMVRLEARFREILSVERPRSFSKPQTVGNRAAEGGDSIKPGA